ncbi:Replication factor A protein 1 [Entamoeba marina]
MSITINSITELFKNRKITIPIIVQVLHVYRIDKSPLIVKAKVSDTVHLMTSLIQCNTQSESDSIKQYGIIKILTGNLHVASDANKTLVFVIQKFQIVNNSVGKQLGTNLKELKKLNQLLTPPVPIICSLINHAPVPIIHSPINHTPLPIFDLSYGKITPLSMLTRYNNKSIVKGVVISKGDKQIYSKGNIFSFIIQDKDGNELKCVCPNDTFLYFDMIVENETYFIYKYELKQPHITSFRSKKMINLDCVINGYTVIQKSKEPIQRIWNITPIRELDDCKCPNFYSICGVVAKIGETEQINNNFRRVVEVVDQSNWLIEINFFGELTEIPDAFKAGQIVLFDNIQLIKNEYKQMKYVKLSKHIINPECDEFTFVAKFLEENNYEVKNETRYSDLIISSIPLMTIKQYEESVEKCNGELFKANVIAYIKFFRTDVISYCICDRCKKRVNINQKQCQYCNKQCTPQHLYNIKISIFDTTGSIFGTMFNNVAKDYMNISVDGLLQLKQTDFDKYIENFQGKTCFKTQFGLEGRIDDKKVIHTIIFYCKILDESK